MTASARRFLVTGASGLLGREVVRQLADQGDEVVALVRPGKPRDTPTSGVTVHELDLARLSGLSDLPNVRYDAVIHLAQPRHYASFPDGAGDVAAIGLGATARLAELALLTGTPRLVFASSGGVYKPSPELRSEAAPLRSQPLPFFLLVKQLGEQLAAAFRPELKITILRYFFVYGADQGPNGLFCRLARSLRARQPIPIAGENGPRLNPIDVRDAAAATIACSGTYTPDVLNVGGNEVVTLREIAMAMAQRLRCQATFVGRPGSPEEVIADTTRMHLVYRPRISVKQGLDDFCGNWLRPLDVQGNLA